MKEGYIKRSIDLSSLDRKSQFLIGPRQIGKTSWINEELEGVALSFNLMDSATFLRLSADPSYLAEAVRMADVENGVVVIDEIQKLPVLLDEVHNILEKSNVRFLLTCSSARKLRGADVNLLGGRSGWKVMYPFVYPEIKDRDISLKKIFHSGLLPSAYLSDNADEDLADYVNLYLTQEIQSEGAVRSLPTFSRFLTAAALANGEVMNMAGMSRAAGISSAGVREWYQLLYDTLIGFEVPAYTLTEKRKSCSTSKFYFFDVGVVRKLQGLSVIQENTQEFGKYLESYIASELRAYLGYRKGYTSNDCKLRYWRSLTAQAVDFVVDGRVAIDVRPTKRSSKSDLKGLRTLKAEELLSRYILVCREKYPLKTDDGIEILPYETFLEELWNDNLI